MSVLLLTLCVTIATNLTNGLLINYTRIGSAFNYQTFRKYILLYFNSYYYGCGVRYLTGYSRILIPDKEWDLLGHILFQIEEYESVKGSSHKFAKK